MTAVASAVGGDRSKTAYASHIARCAPQGQLGERLLPRAVQRQEARFGGYKCGWRGFGAAGDCRFGCGMAVVVAKKGGVGGGGGSPSPSSKPLLGGGPGEYRSSPLNGTRNKRVAVD